MAYTHFPLPKGVPAYEKKDVKKIKSKCFFNAFDIPEFRNCDGKLEFRRPYLVFGKSYSKSIYNIRNNSFLTFKWVIRSILFLDIKDIMTEKKPTPLIKNSKIPQTKGHNSMEMTLLKWHTPIFFYQEGTSLGKKDI